MNQIIIKSQVEFDGLQCIEDNQEIICEVALKLNKVLELKGKCRIIFQKEIICNRYNGQYLVSRGNSAPSIVSRENSAPSIESRENSAPSIESWENSAPSIVSRGNSILRGYGLSLNAKISLFGFSILMKPKGLKIKFVKKSKTSLVRDIQELDFFERHGIDKTKNVVLYKRVSKEYKTQEETANETLWTIGSTLVHHKWSPKDAECGGGKFHACPLPYFADEFRSKVGDKYVAIRIPIADTFEWKDNPQYPHKIAFRTGKVLYECDRKGNRLVKAGE